MQRFTSRLSRLSSLSSFFTRTSRRSFTTHLGNPIPHKLQRPEPNSIPGRFLKRGALGFVRTSRFPAGFSPLQTKPLDSIMDIERATNKSPEDLASIWDDGGFMGQFLLYYLGRGHIGASMKAELYHLLSPRAADWKWLHNNVLSGADASQAGGTQAAPYFTVTCYSEFSGSKYLVLIQGEAVYTRKLSDEESKWLVEAAQSFYLNDARYKQVEWFNKQTRDFKLNDVLQTLDTPTPRFRKDTTGLAE